MFLNHLNIKIDPSPTYILINTNMSDEVNSYFHETSLDLRPHN